MTTNPLPSPLLVPAARACARDGHAGQVDKQGRDYYEYHLAPIAALLAPFGPEVEAAGWLHDVLEDTAATVEILQMAFPPAVVSAVISVTKGEHEPYAHMIRRAAAHPVGRLVKLADNWVNLTGLSDLEKTDPVTAERLRIKYTAAREVLVRAVIGP